MATNTYVALYSTTLANNTTNYVEFTAIPQTYTDLVLVTNITSFGGGGNYIYAQWGNGSIDTGSNYSTTVMSGFTSTTESQRWANRVNYNMDYYATPVTTEPSIRTLNLFNYSNTTTYKTAICRAGRAGAGTDASVGNWRSTQAINTLRITTDQNFFASGSTFALYGIAATGATPVPKASGGTIYSDSTYYYHAFPSTGVFTPTQSITCDYLVVAGGGAGAGGYSTNAKGSGGGAGGYISSIGSSGGGGAAVSPLSLTATAYTITVGAGATGRSGGSGGGLQGTDSSIAGSGLTTITAIGGGGGGTFAGGGTTGGSGGGGAPGSAGNAGTTNQGYAGGSSLAYSNNVNGGGGGGGGAGSVGQNAYDTLVAGAGGSGLTFNLAGSTLSLAGGGGGGAVYLPGGATFGGGAGGIDNGNGNAANANTGGGGGGGSSNTGFTSGGNGGSGIVVIRYLKA